ncbi:MAG: GNAT family N-acetyltransferase [Herpetosiphonaceae bacterium]|nr:GNAT family N-acetyltransferase [Herpetosiphonaceae bacterium]
MVKPINADAVLRTDRLVLEPLQQHHALDLYAILQDERIYRYIPQDPPMSLRLLEQRYHQLERRRSPGDDEVWLNWAVRLKEPPCEYIGRLEASVLQDRMAYLAYELTPDVWGRGYATEACRCVLNILFADYAVIEVLAEVDTRNAASIKLLERLGFGLWGFRAEADFFKGKGSDEYTYRLTAPGPAS